MIKSKKIIGAAVAIAMVAALPTTSMAIGSADAKIGSVETKEFGAITVHRFVGTDIGHVNSYIVESKNSVVVIDTQFFKAQAKELARLVKTIKKPVARVIVTHSHPDHYMGLGEFNEYHTYAAPKTIEGMKKSFQEEKRKARIAMGEPFKSGFPSQITYPKHVLEDKFEVDGVKYEVINMPNTENDDEYVIAVPSAKLIFSGDFIIVGNHQILFDTTAFLKALETAKTWKANYTTLATGHNGFETMDKIDAQESYVKTAKAILDKKPTKAEYLAAIKAAYPQYNADGADFIVMLMDTTYPTLFKK